MLAVICPFCQHENSSGTRFCAQCGCSIHLKICPNPECGKISEVEAETCKFCGQAFPKRVLVPSGTTNTNSSAASQERGGDSTPTRNDQPRSAALPLIMVAIVAGGLPILWANRSLLPMPKTWQASAPEVSQSAVTPAPIAPTPPPANTATPADVASGSPASSPDTTESATKKLGDNQPATGETPKQVAKAPPVKATKKPRTCTEATVALGLCDPKQAAK